MPIPRAKETMIPILDVLADGREHIDEEIQERVALLLELTRQERQRRLKSGTAVYKNRTAWGLVYLQDTKYLADTRPYIRKIGVRNGHEVYRITEAGLAGHGAGSLMPASH